MVCPICKRTKYNEVGPRQGRCMHCGFPRRPVIVRVHERVKKGPQTVVEVGTRMVPEELLSSMSKVSGGGSLTP